MTPDLSLNATEARWLGYLRDQVVGRLGGDADTRARTGAIVAWWALKEGVLDLANPWRHNLCAQDGGQGQIGDLQTCPGNVWQVGMSGIQPSAVTLAAVEAEAKRRYPNRSIQDTLASVAADAGVDAATKNAIVAASGDLRKAWLLRDPAVSFELQRPFVEACFRGTAPGWCFGTWSSAQRFAKDTDTIATMVRALRTYFADAPVVKPGSSLVPWLIGASILGVLAYGYVKENPRTFRQPRIA